MYELLCDGSCEHVQQDFDEVRPAAEEAGRIIRMADDQRDVCG